MYSPTLGRWMQQDPAGYVDGMGAYCYVQDDPNGHVDASGERMQVKGSKAEKERLLTIIQVLAPDAVLDSLTTMTQQGDTRKTCIMT